MLDGLLEVPGFPAYVYSVGSGPDDCRIMLRVQRGNRMPGYVIAWQRDVDGYKICSLRNDAGVRRTIRRAWLVCQHFHGPRPHGMQVAHGDGSKDNDAPSNLRWATPSENARDTVAHGRCPFQRSAFPRAKGVRQHSAKLDDQSARSIFMSDEPVSSLAATYGVSPTVVRHIKQRRLWACATNGLGASPKSRRAPDPRSWPASDVQFLKIGLSSGLTFEAVAKRLGRTSKACSQYAYKHQLVSQSRRKQRVTT